MGEPKKYELGKAKKLVSKILIQRVFKDGHPIFKYPLLLKYIVEDSPLHENGEIKFLASTSSKKIKSAVKRNLEKRRIKEAYRVLSVPVFDTINFKYKTVSLCFVYIATEIVDFKEIEKSVSFLLREFQLKVKK